MSRQVNSCPPQGLLIKAALPLPHGVTRNAARALINGISGYNPREESYYFIDPILTIQLQVWVEAVEIYI